MGTGAVQVSGSRCLCGAACAHFFCRDCLAQHASSLLSEGIAERLQCPEPGCKQPLLQQVVCAAMSSRTMRCMSHESSFSVACSLMSMRQLTPVHAAMLHSDVPGAVPPLARPAAQGQGQLGCN